MTSSWISDHDWFLYSVNETLSCCDVSESIINTSSSYLLSFTTMHNTHSIWHPSVERIDKYFFYLYSTMISCTPLRHSYITISFLSGLFHLVGVQIILAIFGLLADQNTYSSKVSAARYEMTLRIARNNVPSTRTELSDTDRIPCYFSILERIDTKNIPVRV